VDRATQPEGQGGFSGDQDVVLASETRARSARAAAGKTADQGAFAPASKATDDRTQASAAADESGRTLALALFDPLKRVGTDLISRSFRAYCI
jgi:hypothetical protein